ncbi:MAG: leucine-rich repeat domain-containing protein [Candidatus Thorarchaeota archaeon]
MIVSRRSIQERNNDSKILQAQKKHEVTSENVPKQEWSAFEAITTDCQDNPLEIALDLLTIAKNNHLISLNLSGQTLETLSPAIQDFTCLKRLLLIENKLITLPSEFRSLKQLEILYLDKNPLKIVPGVLMELKALQQLSLGETHLSEIPLWIDHLDQLTHLWLNDNALSSLPRTLSHLTKLQRLDLRENPKLKQKYARNWTGKALSDFQRKIASRDS